MKKTSALIVLALFSVLSPLGLAGCGSSTPVAAIPGEGGTDGSTVDGGAVTEAGGTDAPATTDSGLFPADAAPVDKTAITGMTPMSWQFVPIDGAICRDGSPTGIGINANPNSKQLMIFLQGGGACFDTFTCANTPLNASGSSIMSYLAGVGGNGVFNRTDTKNPMADWNFVYVPFCTGDVHAGDRLDGMVPGVSGTQQFVGYLNMARYIARLVPTFPNLTKVLLTGVSAGGFGAALNYAPTARAFSPVPVYLIDDSGPPMVDPYLAKCLSQEQVSLWGFEKTILAECGSDCPDHSNFGIDATIHGLKAYPRIPFGLLDSAGDSTISYFFGLGANNCKTAATLSPAMFTAGLLDTEMKLSPYKNWGAFIFPGTDHTTLGNPCASATDTTCIDGRVAGAADGGAGVVLADWMASIINNGTVSNVGP